MKTLSNTSDTFIPVETWSKEAEARACEESRDASAGAPYYVALDGRVQCVTRRCARELFKHQKICGSISARGTGAGGITPAVLKAAAHGQTVGLSFQLKNVGNNTWMIYCPEMHCEYPTKNPSREMMKLAAEFLDFLEADYADTEQP